MKRFAVFASVAATALLLSGPAVTEKSSDTYRQLDLFGAPAAPKPARKR